MLFVIRFEFYTLYFNPVLWNIVLAFLQTFREMGENIVQFKCNCAIHEKNSQWLQKTYTNCTYFCIKHWNTSIIRTAIYRIYLRYYINLYFTVIVNLLGIMYNCFMFNVELLVSKLKLVTDLVILKIMLL